MRKKFSTDLTDKKWNEIAPLFVRMRKYKCEKRELIDAVLYLVDSGCKWRQLRIFQRISGIGSRNLEENYKAWLASDKSALGS